MYIALIILLAAACVYCAVRFLRLYETGEQVKAVLVKGLTTICVILVCAVSVFHSGNRSFAMLVMAGLTFGFLGDELLHLRFVFTKEGNTVFLIGAYSFLVGHIFYLKALYSVAPKAWIAAIPLVIIGLVVELRNSKKYDLDMGKLFIPLTVYAVVCCFMGASAVGALISHACFGTVLFAIAGVCFVVSDSILSVQCFGNMPDNKKNRWLHAFYWLAQLLIALSPLFIK